MSMSIPSYKQLLSEWIKSCPQKMIYNTIMNRKRVYETLFAENDSQEYFSPSKLLP